MAEYDTTNYQRDLRAAETSAGKRSKGPSVGLEYRWGWLALQAARSRDQFSVNAFVSIPFGEREFIPKIFEPAYFVDDKNPPPRPSRQEWHNDAGYGADLINALVKQDYKNIRVEQEGSNLALVQEFRRSEIVRNPLVAEIEALYADGTAMPTRRAA